MNWHRTPQVLIAVGVFLAGLWVRDFVNAPTVGPIAGIAGLGLLALGGALQLPMVRRRWPRLGSKRSRLSRLYSDTTDIRSKLKRDHKAGSVDRATWEPRLRTFDADFWKRLGAIEADDVRRLKIGVVDFDLVSRNGSQELSHWTPRMLAHLEILRTLVGKRMDAYPLE